MSSYFFDTSALTKRYVVEPGHAWVSSLCVPRAGNSIIIAEITLTEAVTSMSRMTRENPPRMTAARCDRLITLFRQHARNNYLIVQINRMIFTYAADLARKHPLRAYDAIQLACALTYRNDNSKARLPAPTFICADNMLLTVATQEGLAVDNPNLHP